MTAIDAATPAGSLLTAAAVRARTRMIYDAGLRDELAHFTLHPERIDHCARYVAETIRRNYPTLRVPPHSRWRHLNANGHGWTERLGKHLAVDPVERARQRIDLAVTSVLLDAGAGARWSWCDPVTGRLFARSEGLALASLEAFREGLFSSDPALPCRADGAGLARLSSNELARIFQVGPDNPLVGLEGRVDLLRRLGVQLERHPEVYGTPARPGALVDHLQRKAPCLKIQAPAVLEVLLATLDDMWPGRLELDGRNLGDTWRHPAVVVPGPTQGLVPFHKLSQWLTYSLVEPLQEAGFEVSDLDGLTGLAEYRNGGLFVDLGVISPRNAVLAGRPLAPGDEPVVEWRALTVALLDVLAPLVRHDLGVSAEEMPLCSILEGGTWAAGRRIAGELRPGGPPPLTIVSDGTVF